MRNVVKQCFTAIAPILAKCLLSLSVSFCFYLLLLSVQFVGRRIVRLIVHQFFLKFRYSFHASKRDQCDYVQLFNKVSRFKLGRMSQWNVHFCGWNE